ncbi:protein-L-isoaspartate O-methyltransferase family protein [Pelagibacterium xiamenense]|uniref:protein-L-isoaspartate O-methyltransferase family protein n=1 Tax=Pelagibacterium xiamenense TaxID=2901140 RepID=UPI001E2C4402|nr:protein-L-isoaspartate O-methyltransferase [Pelagibacterium xiamenense]MCD7061069.1 protein-L-isoaspartate O-methyltransferase [Pelagibacterium xiamenense]
MVDFAHARRTMVDNQLRTSGITNWRILDVMNRVPRELFVPRTRDALAYSDEEIAVSETRTLPTPAIFGKLVQLAEVGPDDVVLDIACGTGYSTAVLAGLASAVVALEDEEALVTQANDILADLDIGNAAAVCGPLEAGVAKEAPFDVILIEGAVDLVPETLFSQMRDGGRLVAVIGSGNAAVAHLYVKSGQGVVSRAAFNASLPVLDAFKRTQSFAF